MHHRKKIPENINFMWTRHYYYLLYSLAIVSISSQIYFNKNIKPEKGGNLLVSLLQIFWGVYLKYLISNHFADGYDKKIDNPWKWTIFKNKRYKWLALWPTLIWNKEKQNKRNHRHLWTAKLRRHFVRRSPGVRFDDLGGAISYS